MNIIEYTKEQIAEIESIHAAIHAKTIIARDASKDVLGLTHKLASLHTKAATAYFQRQLAANQPTTK